MAQAVPHAVSVRVPDHRVTSQTTRQFWRSASVHASGSRMKYKLGTAGWRLCRRLYCRIDRIALWALHGCTDGPAANTGSVYLDHLSAGRCAAWPQFAADWRHCQRDCAIYRQRRPDAGNRWRRKNLHCCVDFHDVFLHHAPWPTGIKGSHHRVAGFSAGIGALMVISQLACHAGRASVRLRCSRGAGSLCAQAARPNALGSALCSAAPLLPRPLSAPAFRIAYPRPRWRSASFLVAFSVHSHEPEVGSLHLAMPQFAGFSWTPHDVVSLLPSGLMLAFVSSVNLLLTSRTIEHFQGRISLCSGPILTLKLAHTASPIWRLASSAHP